MRRLVVAGLCAYLLFALLTLPAGLAYRWFAPDGLQLSGISGSVWSGSAAAARLGTTVLGRTEWRARPLGLLRGRLGYRIHTRVPGGALSGDVAVASGGRTYLRSVAGVVPLALVEPLVPRGLLEGRIGIDLTRVVVRDGWPLDAIGTVDVVDLTLLVPVREALGSYSVVFDGSENEQLSGRFTDLDGPIEASGRIVLRPDRQWLVDGELSARAGSSDTVVEALKWIGPRDGRGRHTLRRSGQL